MGIILKKYLDFWRRLLKIQKISNILKTGVTKFRFVKFESKLFQVETILKRTRSTSLTIITESVQYSLVSYLLTVSLVK